MARSGAISALRFVCSAIFLLAGAAAFAQPQQGVAVLASESVKRAPKSSEVNGWLHHAAEELHVSDRVLPHIMVIYVASDAGAVEYLPSRIMLQVEISTTSKLPLYYIWLIGETGAESTIQGIISVLNQQFDLKLDHDAMAAVAHRIANRLEATVDVRALRAR